jgi:hypothetical protein
MFGVWSELQGSIKEVQHDNYSKAEKWLDRMQESADGQDAVQEELQPLTI